MRQIRIATRGSDLALWQANHVREALIAASPGLEVELVVITTTGDKILDRPLAEIGGKALFVKEIEQALLDDTADIAVHSMKDVPVPLAPGLHLAAISSREDPRDAMCSVACSSFDALPKQARVGTSSLRRGCQLLARRRDIQIVPLRGNVPTRLRKLHEGQFDAIVLAAAGLLRLEQGEQIRQRLAVDICLPAVGQGVLGLETRRGDDPVIALARKAMHDPSTASCVAAERAFLGALEGDCRTPIAAYATVAQTELHITGLVGTPDGKRIVRKEARGPSDQAGQLGLNLARELLAHGAREILPQLRGDI